MAEPATEVIEEPAAVAPVVPTPVEEKLLSESEVNRIVQERLARATKDQPSKDELAELRAAKTQLDEITLAGATELEKANAAKEKAEATAAEATARADKTLIKAAAVAELVKQDVTNVEGALRALDTTGLTVGDDGTVSGMSEAVTSLLEVIPEFVGKVVPVKVDQGARGGGASGTEQVTAAQLDSMSAEAIAKATREGRMVDILG